MISIKAKKLFSYLNPFEDRLPGQDIFFNKEAITNYLTHSNIYHVEGDDDFENNYRKIAYLVSHPENLFIKLNIPNSEHDLEDMIVQENDNIFVFVALAYLNPDSISAELSGDKKFAKTFFGVSQKEDFFFTQEALTVHNFSHIVDWSINENLLLETWRDKEFVLKNIDSSNIHINYKLIPPEFWSEPDFFAGMLKKIDKYDHRNPEIFNYLIKHHKYNPFMLEYIFENYKSFELFKSHYFNDYVEYKKGNVIDPNQSLIEQYLEKHSILMRWMRNSHNQEIISTCFDKQRWENKETVIEWYKMKLEDSFVDFNPLLHNDYRYHKSMRDWVTEQTQEWKSQLFESLVDTFLEHKQRSNRNNHDSFDSSFNQLIFTKDFDTQNFYHDINDFYSSQQDVYMTSFAEFYKNCQIKPVISEDMATFIINNHPKKFYLLDDSFRTLDNLKKLLPYNIRISIEEIQKFNNKEFNLSLIEYGGTSALLEAFPISYFLDEDYLLPLLKNKSINLKSKSLTNFIEKNTALTKACIQSGNHQYLSPKIFQDVELSAFLVGTVFSENYKNSSFNFSKESIFGLINPSVLSNLQSLEKILTVSRGNYLPRVQHLFKQREFAQMVFKLYDEEKITNTNYLPIEVRLVLDAYRIEGNYLIFFNKFDLQANLNNKLVSNSTQKKVTKKI